MSKPDNKAIVAQSQAILKALGYKIKTSHLYEYLAKLNDYPSWNVASAKKVNLSEKLDLNIPEPDTEERVSIRLATLESILKDLNTRKIEVIGRTYQNGGCYTFTTSVPVDVLAEASGLSSDYFNHMTKIQQLEHAVAFEEWSKAHPDLFPVVKSTYPSSETEHDGYPEEDDDDGYPPDDYDDCESVEETSASDSDDDYDDYEPDDSYDEPEFDGPSEEEQMAALKARAAFERAYAAKKGAL
jgi:hypothetical protein